MRNNSFGFCGGAFGDEGKGRIVDEYVHHFSQKHQVIVYRDNGGANAGHTVELPDGKRIAFHQLPSGVFHKNTTVILGKGMVIHPGDLCSEIQSVMEVSGKRIPAVIWIDEMAVLSLDTHRAYEIALKSRMDGGKGATGRGIAPAYADILLRHPLRMRDLVNKNINAIHKHYQLYQALLKGLGIDLEKAKVPSLKFTDGLLVGSIDDFTQRLVNDIPILKSITKDLNQYISKTWNDPKYYFIFEKAQAVGLDYRFGVYPDVSASDTTFGGIYSATEGIIHPKDIKLRAAVIKATYMSSVGTRILPTMMEDKSANRIREDAFEYGATTRRPRGIAYIDIPALRFFCQAGDVNGLILTHMDVIYYDTPIKICTSYTKNGKTVNYRPDQEYLLSVKPVYTEYKSWDKKSVQFAKSYQQIPKEAKLYIKSISKLLNTKIILITTGPRRNQSIKIPANI
jgi:adenylosuccinate synthase